MIKWVYICVAPPMLIFIFILVVVPHLAVKLVASYYRWFYRDLLHKSDAELEGTLITPLDRFFYRDMLNLIQVGTERPKELQRLVTAYRILGIAMLCMVGFTSVLMVIALYAA